MRIDWCQIVGGSARVHQRLLRDNDKRSFVHEVQPTADRPVLPYRAYLTAVAIFADGPATDDPSADERLPARCTGTGRW